jgi:hypothetical protein
MHPSVANDWQHIATYITTAYLKKTFFYGKIYHNYSKSFFPSSILDKLSYDLTRLSVYMFVGDLLNNVEQHVNIY